MNYKMSMNKILYAFAVVATMTSCATSWRVEGTSSVSALDGNKLYLRAVKSGEVRNIDSCDVVHGEFHFAGLLDTVRMANLYMDDESIMPVVIEDCPLTITLDENERRVRGSALNDSLFAFIKRKTALDAQIADLPHRESRMIFEGRDHDEILAELNQEAAMLQMQDEKLVMGFIKANMDNVLGPGVFMIVTSNLPYPILDPSLEELITLASPHFLADPYVQEFVRLARANMEKLNE